MSNFKLISVLIIFLTIVKNSNGDISISTKKLLVRKDEVAQFNVTVTNLNTTDLELELIVQHPDIVNVNPSVLKPNGSDSFEFYFNGTYAGHSEVTSSASRKDIDVSPLFLVVDVCNNKVVDLISKIVGWIFIISWGASFYPQIYVNYKRQCVIGMHFDYWALDIVGYISFGIYIHSLYFIPGIQELYFERYPRGLIPVKTNDVVYNLHGTFAIILTIIQCFKYESGDQKISYTARIILGGVALFYVVGLTLYGLELVHILDLFYYCSYVKLIITVLKYIPQVYMNYKRKSTDGWCIGVVFLDLNGGVFSILQMILDSYNYNDWVSIFGNPTKFGLGVITIFFHCLFMVQHYILYRSPGYIHIV
ncbi:hypothetical protein RI129_006880 [Pyrocoelia pectoralis]|uniref:Cystinosin n=1 Tax=Pyrocoelia pectoralis TaxID=417401 RepID=A0AAN7VBK0_9COLE